MNLLPVRVTPLAKGEAPGHPFRGNQHTGGIGGGGQSSGLPNNRVGPFQPSWFQSGATSDAIVHATHRIVGKVDVDLLIAANPPKPGEKLFAWQGRMVSMMDANTKNDVLAVCRESYPPVDYIAQGAARWREMHHLPEPQADIAAQTVDLDKAAKVARYFDTAPDQSADPAVQHAYDDFKRQNEAQWQFATMPVSKGGLGIKVSFSPNSQGDPYPSAEAQAEDLRRNHHITTQAGLGGEHGSTMSPDEYNRFRAVHDIFGHAAVGRGFDRHGEYDAWLQHMTMYTGLGRNAMTSEYHGVNSSLWDSSPQGLKYAGTGKSVLLPPSLLRDPWDNHGRLVRKDGGYVDLSVIAYIIQRLHLGPEFAAQFERGYWHGGDGVQKGEAPGHPFRGNQYKTGTSGSDKPKHETPPNGGTFWPTSGNNDSVHHAPTHRGKLITDNVDAAAQALAQGVDVELRQPREVSTLLDRLASLVHDAEAKGENAPNYNLCQVSVAGSNVFCAGNKGIARDLMPQLSGIARPGSKADALPKDNQGGVDLTNQFVDALKAQGTRVTNDMESAAYLRSTQNELVGKKVAGIAGALRAGGQRGEHIRSGSIFVSKDNYIVDGHHRWAGMVGVDASDNHLGDEKMHIKRIDMPILDILKFANKFTDEWGIERKSGKAGGKVKKGHVMLRHLLPVRVGVAKGEGSGHPFRGNQYVAGEGGTASPNQLTRHAEAHTYGFTMDPKSGQDIKSGWAVGLDNAKSLLVSEQDWQAHKLDIVKAYRTELLATQKTNPNVKFGGWFDTTHNEWVLDHVEVQPNSDKGRETAVSLGKERDQQSVFHIDSLNEVPTGGSGGRDRARRYSTKDIRKRLLPIAF